MANIGKIAVQLQAHTGQFTKGMIRASSTLQRFGNMNRRFAKSPLAFLGGAAVSGLRSAASMVTQLFRRLAVVMTAVSAGFAFLTLRGARAADSLAKTARTIGLSNEALAGFRYGAERAGVESAIMDKSLQRLAKSTSEASMGFGTAMRAFEQLGLDAKAINKLSIDKQFLAVVSALEKIESQSDKIRIVTEIFGRQGAALLNLTDQGSKAIEASIQRAKLLGLSLGSSQTAVIEAMNDRIDDMKDAFSGFFQQMAAKFAPIVNEIGNQFIGWLESMGGIPQIAEIAFNAIGEAAQKAGNFAIKTFGGIIRTVERLQAIFLRLKATIINVFSAPFRLVEATRDNLGTVGKILTWNPVRDAIIGGSDDASLKAFNKSLEEQGANALSKAKEIEKNLSTGESLGDRFEKFAFKGMDKVQSLVDKAKQGVQERLKTETQITDELEEQRKILTGSFAQGQIGRVAFGPTGIMDTVRNASSAVAGPKNDETARQVMRSNQILERIEANTSTPQQTALA